MGRRPLRGQQDPRGGKTLLDLPEGVARDPEVSFDGKKVLFGDKDYALDESIEAIQLGHVGQLSGLSA